MVSRGYRLFHRPRTRQVEHRTRHAGHRDAVDHNDLVVGQRRRIHMQQDPPVAFPWPGHVYPHILGQPDREFVQHRRRVMTHDRAVDQLRHGCVDQLAVQGFSADVALARYRVRSAPDLLKVAAAPQAGDLVIGEALVAQGPGQQNLVHAGHCNRCPVSGVRGPDHICG